ncbi:LysE family translocator [Janthinobacterium fluminis]|uniref:LysE family translocator n=1 Tax=Janthinobacterium fluminis TaxID=2987524 RepID=A0ABT5JVH2_9BURK|nr:LysE family translocator [Janthinobacterium fluminis]MDC8756175.1 LysE family translocator [Janthinobacterium fluminis]
MNELLAVAAITILAVISPGADFAMVTRNSYLHGRHAGLLAAAGIALGVQVHVIYTMLGVGLLIAHSPTLFVAIKLAGAAYLVYTGCRTFMAPAVPDAERARTASGALASLRAGFMTNALNPKTTLFVLSTYTQVVSADTALGARIGYGLFMSLAHGFWFGLVALFFSNARLRGAMLRGQRVLNKGIGAVLMGLGLTLALAPLSR